MVTNFHLRSSDGRDTHFLSRVYGPQKRVYDHLWLCPCSRLRACMEAPLKRTLRYLPLTLGRVFDP